MCRSTRFNCQLSLKGAINVRSLRSGNRLKRFSSYSPVQNSCWSVRPYCLPPGSEGEDGCDRLDFFADRVCERCNSAVCQLGPELLGRTRRMNVRNDLELVAQ